MDHGLIILEFERNRCPEVFEFYKRCEIEYINGVNMAKYSFSNFLKGLSFT